MRAPSAMPAEKIDAFVSEHAGWIRKQFTAYERRAERFSSVREGQTILLDGKEYPLVCGTARNSEKGGTVCLKNMRGAQAFFIKTRAFLLVEKTAALSRRAGLYPEDVSVRDFKARWGSCDAQKRIKLNWRLLMLPPELQEYVIAHELCHIAHLDHSPAFWAEVAKIIPDFAKRKRALKEYSFLTLLYR